MVSKTFITTAITLLTIYGASKFMNSTAPRMLSTEEQAITSSWTHWKMTHGKSYGSDAEHTYRAKVFRDNYKKIKDHNSTPGNTSTVGLNKFADLDTAEFGRQYAKGLLKREKNLKKNNIVRLPEDNLPASVNWTDVMNPVKDQQQCGSCWAFSAVGAIEAAHTIKTGEKANYAEQQLVDCAGGTYHNHGCHGGLMDYAFDYVKYNPLELTTNYHYTARDGTCKAVTSLEVGHISGYDDVPPNSIGQLKAAIFKRPVSVAIEADTYPFQFYTGGVITSTACGTSLDHGVLAIGYETEAVDPYFLVRNSWGASWGDHGHVKIGINNICGILSEPSYPSAA